MSQKRPASAPKPLPGCRLSGPVSLLAPAAFEEVRCGATLPAMTPRTAATSLLHGIAPLLYGLMALAAPGFVAAGGERGVECAAIDDPSARLACYDAAFPRPAPGSRGVPPAAPAVVQTPASAAIAPAVLPATVPAARPASEAEEFGLSERQRAAREPQPEKPPATAVTAAVTAVRKLPTGYLRIDLDNDQAWQQTEIDPNIRLRTGDRVTIRKAALGSFLLETPGRFSTRVRRVK